jgi:hypothetical protein
MARKGIDLGLLAALTPLTAAIAVGLRTLLQDTVNPDSSPGFLGLGLSVVALFFVVIFLAAFVALVARIVSAIAELKVGLWPTLSDTMLRFALYVLFYWLGLWGMAFVLSMALYAALRGSLGVVAAGGVSIVGAVLVGSLAVRVVRPMLTPLAPALGVLPGAVRMPFFLVCIAIGAAFLQTAYVFEAKSSQAIYKTSDTLQLGIVAKGRLFNHDRLRAHVFRLDGGETLVSEVKLVPGEAGEYQGWWTLTSAPPGVFKIVVSFSDYPPKSPWERMKAVMANNHLRRILLFNVVPG